MRKLIVGGAVLAAAVVLLDGLSGRALSQQVEEVWVANFPEVQAVRGTVEVAGPYRRAVLVRREEVVVSPGRREEVSELIPAGLLDADGFTGVVLSLQGEVQDDTFRAGTVGAVLIPDQRPVLRALRDDGRIQLALEVTAPLAPAASSFFASDPVRLPLAFPRYQIFLYNSSDKTVEANLYAYLTQ